MRTLTLLLTLLLTPAAQAADHPRLPAPTAADIAAATNTQTTAQAQTVVTLNQTVKAGTLISEDMLTEQPAPAKLAVMPWVQDKSTLIGLEARTNISAGTPLYPRQFRPVPDIHRNQPVTLVYKKKGLSVSLEGVALEDGTKGQNIRVTNTESRKAISGTVTGPNTVTIQK